MTDRKRDADLEAFLLKEGTDPAVARRLAEKSEPEDDVQVGDTEATPTRPPVTGPALAERWAKVVKVMKPTPGRVEATLARRPKKPPGE